MVIRLMCDVALGILSYAMGVAADSWQAIMDRYLTLGDESADEKAVMKENMLRLINLYYDALDAPKKTGQRVSCYKLLFYI